MMTTANQPPTPPLPLCFLHLRALVLALGETASPAWWKTAFMSETGLRFLERLYPRTAFCAAIHAAGQAARDAHDRAVGRVGAHHLFRLPESLEIEVHRLGPDSAEDGFFPALRQALGRPEDLLRLLAAMAEGEGAEAAPGPRRIGARKDLMSRAGIRKTAAAYHAAFADNAPCFPYFTADADGTAADHG